LLNNIAIIIITLEEMSFNINIKLSGIGETFSVEVTNEDTVEVIVAKCCEAREDLEPERVTLVFKGKILKADQTADSLKLEEGVTIHLVRKPVPKASKPAATNSATSSSSMPSATGGATTGASTATGTAGTGTSVPPPPNPFAGLSGSLPNLAAGGGLSGMGGMNLDPNTIQSMMSNPMFTSMMDQMLQNPDFMNSMIDNNPSLRAMADSNPMVREMLQNPDMMRNMMTPEAIQASMNLMNNANANNSFGTMSGAAGSMPAPGGGSTSGTSGAAGTSGSGATATPATTGSTAPAAAGTTSGTTGKH
jgi:ubiquilin